MYNVIDNWDGDQKDALDHADEEVMPILSPTPTVFKAAAWLNFGLDGTEKLFPASAVAEGLKKFSIPIAIANYAVDGFKELYADEVKKLTHFSQKNIVQ